MHKIYLLLRDNKQSGPHSLEELMQTNLKPTDLIWVEGKSHCWSYPTEIELLKPYVSQAKASLSANTGVAYPAALPESHGSYLPAEPKKPEQKSLSSGKVYVSMPNQGGHASQTVQQPDPASSKPATYNLEQKADELRARVQAQAAENRPAQPAKDDTIQVKSSRPLSDIEAEYTSWVYKKKSAGRKGLSSRTQAAILAIFIVAGSYVAAKYFFATEEATVQPPAIPGRISEKAANPSSLQTTVSLKEPAAEEMTSTNEVVQMDHGQPGALGRKAVPASLPVNNKSVTAKKDEKAVQVKMNKEKAEGEETIETRKEETYPRPADDAPVAAAPVKKKKFGEKLDDFFNKFKRKKTDEKPEAAGKPAEEPETTPANGRMPERKARHRDDETPAAPKAADIKEFINITSSEPSEKWMLGIQDLKLTLHNQSSELIKTAAVEVRYYNDQNDLLDTKTVTFNRVPAKRSVTLAAPGHRLANHTDYRLVSATN